MKCREGGHASVYNLPSTHDRRGNLREGTGERLGLITQCSVVDSPLLPLLGPLTCRTTVGPAERTREVSNRTCASPCYHIWQIPKLPTLTNPQKQFLNSAKPFAHLRSASQLLHFLKEMKRKLDYCPILRNCAYYLRSREKHQTGRRKALLASVSLLEGCELLEDISNLLCILI